LSQEVTLLVLKEIYLYVSLYQKYLKNELLDVFFVGKKYVLVGDDEDENEISFKK